MVKKMQWFDRKFNFDFPVYMLPCIIERLRGTPARLVEIVESLPPKNLTKKIDNTWSIQEHIGHLLDLDELHLGRMDDYKNKVSVLRPADVSNKKTIEANHNKNDIQNILTWFRAERMNLVKLLEAVNEEEASAEAEHPRLKKQMRLVDMAFFVAEHDDHHIASIRELIKLFDNIN